MDSCDPYHFITMASNIINSMNSTIMDPSNKFTKEQMAKLTPKLSELLGNISVVGAKVGFLEGELKAYTNISQQKPPQVQSLPNTIQDLPGICETLAEMEERKLRSKNIIMFNVPECSTGTQTDCMREDRNKVLSILNKVENVDTSEIKMFRLGKKEMEKTRPIKIELSDQHQVKLVLQKKAIDYQNVSIKTKKDLTWVQRQEIQNVWKELENRKNKGENNLTIKYINNSPKIVTTTPKN